MVTYAFIDDIPSERERHSALLTGDGLTVMPVEPPASFDDTKSILDGCDGILLDYRLSLDGKGVSYNGPVLAGHVRDVLPELPIVVLSALQAVESSRSYQRTEPLYDWRIDKTDVGKNADLARAQLKSLARGYQTLCELLGAQEPEQASRMREALGAPDGMEEIASWICAESRGGVNYATANILPLLYLPGPLLPLQWAAVQMGVCPSASSQLEPFLAEARYRGVFAEMFEIPCFWRDMLEDCETPNDLPPALCTASGGAADTLCVQCGDPFASYYTVGIERMAVPEPVRHGRVCGFCLGGDGVQEGWRVSPCSMPLVPSVIAETTAASKRDA